MNKLDTLTPSRLQISAVIDEFGARTVLMASFKALLFARKPRKAKPVKADLSRLDDRLRRDIGLLPRHLQSTFPHRSP